MKIAALDAHYTPPEIAEAVAEIAVDGLGDDLSIFDLAAGEGALLRAVTKVSHCHRVGAADVDAGAIELMRLKFPEWIVSRCNSLSRRSLSNSKLMRSQVSWDLGVLNPPFSCRGMRTYETKLVGETIRTTQALAFVLVALGQVGPSGRVVAILPQGSQKSHKDDRGWELIRSIAAVEIAGAYGRGAFPSATVATEVVVIDRQSRAFGTIASVARSAEDPVPDVTRGWQKMHLRLADPSGVALLHTTDLARSSPIEGSERIVSTRQLTGPAVLIPRVGKPDLNKVKVLGVEQPVALSDCVFAVPAPSIAAAKRLRARIAGQWLQFESLYVGPCAPHLTTQRLQEFLASVD